MQIVDKIASILDLLSTGEELSVSEIADRVEIPMPTAHRLLTALTEKGMLEKDLKTKRYSLGWILVRYSNCVRDTNESKYRIKMLAPIMQEFTQKTGETVTLAAFTGSRVVLINVIEGTHALRWFSSVGKTMPFHAAAPAKLFLTYMPEKGRKKLLKGIQYYIYTENTIRSEAALMEELAAARRDRVAYCINELDDYCMAVSVPILDKNGVMAYALTAVGHSVRMEENAASVLENLRASAKRMESML